MKSGSFQTSAYTWTSSDGVKRSLYHIIEWSLVETDVGRNVSKIKITVRSAGGSTWSVNEKKAEVLIDDVSVWYRSATESRRSGATILDQVFEVEHTNDGTKTFKLTFAVCLGGGSSQNRTKSAEFELDTIPRKANITSAPDFDDLSSPVVTYSSPAGEAVTTLQIGIGTSSEVADLASFREISKTGTSFTFELTVDELNAMRNATTDTSREVFFIIKTVLGGVTFYSSEEKIFTMADADAARPDAETFMTGVSLFEGMYLQGLSKVTVATTASGKNGATITSISTTIGSMSYPGDNITSDLLTTPGEVAVTTSVTDSRGFTTTVVKTITVTEYSKPLLTAYEGNNSVLLYRADASGSAKDDSPLLRLMASVSYSAVPGNTPTLMYRYRHSGDASYGGYLPLQLSGKNYNDSLPENFLAINSYVIEVTVFDTVGRSSSMPFDVPTARRDFQLKRGGGGASFGKASELDGVLDVAWGIFARGGFCAAVIPSEDNINEYTHVGEYVVETDAISINVRNLPEAKAGRLIVFAATGNYTDIDGADKTVIQVYVTYQARVYIRAVSTGNIGAWRTIL